LNKPFDEDFFSIPLEEYATGKESGKDEQRRVRIFVTEFFTPFLVLLRAICVNVLVAGHRPADLRATTAQFLSPFVQRS